MVMPAIVIVVIKAFSEAYVLIKERAFGLGRKKSTSHVHAATGIFVTFVYFAFLKLVTKGLEAFDCSAVEKSDDASLTEKYMEITYWACYRSKHSLLVLGSAVALFVYGVGLPGCVVATFVRATNKRRAKEDQLLRAHGVDDETELSNPHCVNFRRSYGSLYSAYKPGMWYWTLLVLMKKIIAAVISGLLRNSNLQMCAYLIVCLVSIVSRYASQPLMSMSERGEVLEKHAFDSERYLEEALRRSPNDAPEVPKRPTSRFLWNYNKVQALLDVLFVLLCVLGIIFNTLEEEGSEYAVCEIFAIAVIATVFVFLTVVMMSEVLSLNNVSPLSCIFKREVHDIVPTTESLRDLNVAAPAVEHSVAVPAADHDADDEYDLR